MLEWNVEKTAELLNSAESKIQYIGIAISDPTKLSYITDDRQDRFDGDFWDEAKRKSFAYMGKVGKVLGKINSQIKLESKEVEKLQAAIAAKSNTSNFEIVTGEDITKWYCEENYAENQGTLSQSCMRFSSCEDYFEIYEENAKMVILKDDNNKLIGRSILWTAERENGEEIKFLDRIYGTNQTIERFKIYAKAHKLFFKVDQSFNNRKITNDIDVIYENLMINIGKVYDHYPYMDTMKYLDPNGNLHSIEDNDTRALTNISGNSAGTRCHDCHDVYADDDMFVTVDGDNICRDCMEAHYVLIHGELFHKDDDRVFRCQDCKEWHLVNGGATCHKVYNHYVCSNCFDN